MPIALHGLGAIRGDPVAVEERPELRRALVQGATLFRIKSATPSWR